MTEQQKEDQQYCAPCGEGGRDEMGFQPDEEENAHWWEVMRTLLYYSEFFETELDRRQRHINKLNNIYMQRLPDVTFEKFRLLQEKAEINQHMFDDMVYFHASNSYLPPPKYVLDQSPPEFDGKHRDSSYLPHKDIGPGVDIRQQHRNQAILHSIYREWSLEGASEREQSFKPMIDALLKYKPIEKDDSNVFEQHVLVPGCGLGRLAVEIAAQGYCCEGNEYSAYMATASNFVLNGITTANAYEIYPWAANICNIAKVADTLESVRFPDATAMDILQSKYPMTAGKENSDYPKFSMAAGNFMDLYGNKSNAGQWDAVVTCFFIDTAPVVIEYIDCIHHVLKPGGIWINLGPLLYHWVADVEANEDERYDQSIELSYEEIKHVIDTFGFEWLEESHLTNVYYTRHAKSLMATQYNPVLFTVRKPLTQTN